MPDSSKFLDGKKFMWDGVVYESESVAQETKKKFEEDNFEVELISEEEQHFLYTRRVVKEIVVEGEPSAA